MRRESIEKGRWLVRFDIEKGVSNVLSSHKNDVRFSGLDPSGRLALSTGGDGVVRVGPVTGEEPHLLFAHEGLVRWVVVSPDGRWVASSGDDGTIRLSPMPEGKPFHILPLTEILDRLRAVTNVRVVDDEASSTGYRVATIQTMASDNAPFPGWETVPEW
jgi:WD40 repeat protein